MLPIICSLSLSEMGSLVIAFWINTFRFFPCTKSIPSKQITTNLYRWTLLDWIGALALSRFRQFATFWLWVRSQYCLNLWQITFYREGLIQKFQLLVADEKSQLETSVWMIWFSGFKSLTSPFLNSWPKWEEPKAVSSLDENSWTHFLG